MECMLTCSTQRIKIPNAAELQVSLRQNFEFRPGSLSTSNIHDPVVGFQVAAFLRLYSTVNRASLLACKAIQSFFLHLVFVRAPERSSLN